jgi:hypothetical protein
MLCEALLPDAVDGTLSPAEQRIFDQHVSSCVECSREYAEAQRGAAWLSVLKSQTPEPPETLLAKILAGTTGVAAPAVAAEPTPWAQPVAHPAAGRGSSWGVRAAAWRTRVGDIFRIDNAAMSFQPRLAMTAAMAFFSIALTLNMTGFRLRDVRAENFTPSGIRRTVSDMSASAARSFQNLRVVYQVESRVSELRDDQAPAAGRDDRPTFEAQPEQVQPGGSEFPATQPGRNQQNDSQPVNPGKDNDGNQQQGQQQGQQNDQHNFQPHGRSELNLPLAPPTGRNAATTHKAA